MTCMTLQTHAKYNPHHPACLLPFQAPGSPPESRKLCSPVDHNSYSPQDSFSSSSSSCYDSPTRMESSHHGFASEHYQHCNLQDCYCLPHCWPGQQESFSVPEYTPYHNPTDYPYTCTVEENYLMRDLQIPRDVLQCAMMRASAVWCCLLAVNRILFSMLLRAWAVMEWIWWMLNRLKGWYFCIKYSFLLHFDLFFYTQLVAVIIKKMCWTHQRARVHLLSIHT